MQRKEELALIHAVPLADITGEHALKKMTKRAQICKAKQFKMVKPALIDKTMYKEKVAVIDTAGNTYRKEPMRKMAIIKKAERQVKKMQKQNQDEQFFVEDFLPHNGANKMKRQQKRELRDAWDEIDEEF